MSAFTVTEAVAVMLKRVCDHTCVQQPRGKTTVHCDARVDVTGETSSWSPRRYRPLRSDLRSVASS
jgi:hypothetical protein